MTYNIAIDGPAGAGKSTIAKRVSGELSFIYVDTGAMYRSIALYLLRKDISATDVEAVKVALEDIEIAIQYVNGEQHVLLNGEDVSGQIRTEEVGNMASKSSALPCVRAKLLELQKKLAREHDVVMDGRDIGTNILPDAQLKIYLTASVRHQSQPAEYKETYRKRHRTAIWRQSKKTLSRETIRICTERQHRSCRQKMLFILIPQI